MNGWLNANVVVPVGLRGAAQRTFEFPVGGTSVFLTGSPGCGKTFLANQIIEALRGSALTVAACGSSGAAAALVDGITLHSWVGFCNGDADVASPLSVVLHKVIPLSAKLRMCASMVLVVDEVGTLSAAILARLGLVLARCGAGTLRLAG